jgi:hypothetical protein
VTAFTDLDVILLIHPIRVNPTMKLVIFVLLGAKSCNWRHSSFGSVLRLAYSADLFRAVLVASRLMTHLTASGGYRSGVCRSTTAAASGGDCVWVWVWARAGELRGIPVREPLRATVGSHGTSGGNSNYVKHLYLSSL